MALGLAPTGTVALGLTKAQVAAGIAGTLAVTLAAATVVSTGSVPGVPFLSAAAATNITGTTVTPRVTITFS